MKNIRIFLSENAHFLVVKFSVYLSRHVFVMLSVILYELKLHNKLPYSPISREV